MVMFMLGMLPRRTIAVCCWVLGVRDDDEGWRVTLRLPHIPPHSTSTHTHTLHQISVFMQTHTHTLHTLLARVHLTGVTLHLLTQQCKTSSCHFTFLEDTWKYCSVFFQHSSNLLINLSTRKWLIHLSGFTENMVFGIYYWEETVIGRLACLFTELHRNWEN